MMLLTSNLEQSWVDFARQPFGEFGGESDDLAEGPVVEANAFD